MNVALLCLLAAGLAGLASTLLELAWLRAATAALPGTLPAGAIVLPAMLVAWAAGAAIAGRRADRCRSCLATCARWLAAGAAAVLLAPWILAALLPDAAANATLARLLAAALPAAPAAFCLGGALPLLARLRHDAALPAVRAAGGATAALTAGAALGCWLYVPALSDSPGPLVLAACALTVAALICWLLSGWEPARAVDPARAAASIPAARAGVARGESGAVLALMALLGGALLVAGQLALLRVIAQYHGDSIATSSAVLLAVHAGMAIGAVLLCLLPASLPAGVLVWLLLALAAVALMLPALLLPGLELPGLPTAGLAAFGGTSALRLALLFGVPLGAGAGCVVTAASRARGTERWGGWVGNLTALSTLGGAAGGALYVWVIAPAPGWGTGRLLRDAAVLAAALGACAALATLLASRPRSPAEGAPSRGLRCWLVAALVALVTAGLITIDRRHPPLQLPWRSSADESGLLQGAEGPWGVVSLVSTTDGGMRLKVDNRFSQGGTGGSLLARRLGRIAASFRPDAQRALLLGLGAGHTLAGLAASSPASVECVEHNAQILALQLPVPFESGQEPRGGPPHLIHADARAWLASHPRSYDLIVGDLFFPWMPGAGDLFSREEFLVMRSALREGGVAVQWLPLHQVPWPAFGAVVNAFLEAFPDARLFVASADAGTPLVALVGGLVKGLPRAEDVDALLAAAPSAAGPSAAADVWDLYLADSWTLQSRFREQPADTLDAPWVELLSLGRQDDEDEIARTNLRLLAELAVPLDTSSLSARPPDEKLNRRLGAELTARSTALSALLHARAAIRQLHDAAPGSLAEADRAALAADVTNALLLGWRAAPGHLDVRDTLLERANELTHEDRWEAAGALLEASLGILPDPHLQGLLGGIRLHEHYTDQALAVLRQAFAQAPHDRTVLVNLGSALLLAGGHDGEARTILAEARGTFADGAMPPLQGTALALLEGDTRAVPVAQALRDKLPAGEGWSQALQRLIAHVGAPAPAVPLAPSEPATSAGSQPPGG